VYFIAFYVLTGCGMMFNIIIASGALISTNNRKKNLPQERLSDIICNAHVVLLKKEIRNYSG